MSQATGVFKKHSGYVIFVIECGSTNWQRQIMWSRSQRVVNVTLGWQEMEQSMRTVGSDLSEKFIISLRTDGAQCWCCSRAETKGYRAPEECLETSMIGCRGETSPCRRHVCQLGYDCSLEYSVKRICWQAVVTKRAQCKQRLRTGNEKSVDMLRDWKFPAESNTQCFNTLDSWYAWNSRRGNNNCSVTSRWDKNYLCRLGMI